MTLGKPRSLPAVPTAGGWVVPTLWAPSPPWASDHKDHTHMVLTSSPLAPGQSVDLAVVVRRIGF